MRAYYIEKGKKIYLEDGTIYHGCYRWEVGE